MVASEYTSRERPSRCPNCDSESVLPMLWGVPTAEMTREAEEGRAVLGESGVAEYPWCCEECGTRIYQRVDAPAADAAK